MADIKPILQDAEFQALPFEEKRKVLVGADSDFAALPQAEQVRAMNGMGAGVLATEHPIATAASKIYHPALEVGGMVGGEMVEPAGGGILGYAAGDSAANLIDRGLGIRKPPDSLLSALGEAVKSTAKGTLAQMTGDVTGAVIKGTASTAASMTSASEESAARALAEKAREMGVRLTPNQIMQTQPKSLLEAVLERMPLSSSMIQRFKGDAGAAVEKSAQKLLDDIGSAELPQTSGKAAQEAIQRVNFERLKVRDKLFDRLTKFVDEAEGTQTALKTAAKASDTTAADVLQGAKLGGQKGLPVAATGPTMTLTNFGTTARDLLAKEGQVLEGMQDKKLSDFLFKLSDQDAKMTFAGAKVQRERLRALIGPVADTPEKQVYKKLLGALDDDISTWAVAQGGKIEKAFRKANAFHGAVKQLASDPNIQKIMAANPEDVVNIVFKPGNVTELQMLRKATREQDYGGMQKAFIRRLFSDAGGGTEAGLTQNFQKNMKRYGVNTVNAALGPENASKLQEFAQIVNASQRGAAASAGNPSGTAPTLLSYAAPAGAGAAFAMHNPVLGTTILLAPAAVAKIYLSEGGRKLVSEALSTAASSSNAFGTAAALTRLIQKEQAETPGTIITPFDPKSSKKTPVTDAVGRVLNVLDPSAQATPTAASTPASAPPPKMSQDAAAYRTGLQSFLSNDMEGAKTQWMKAYKLNPHRLEARRGLERIAMKEGKDIDTYTKR
jgi:hypothetical protein